MPSGYQERTGVRLLWGTANLFTHPRYQAGAATNPDPEVFAYAAAQVKHMLEVTQRLGGENYVLWGGREGYDTLLNTDLKREGDQLARFLHLVADHKHRIGFEGQLLIEPKPMEPTKHQYDYDVATVHGFLVRHGLEGEYQVNIEANHATLAGHSFHHEVAFAVANGILGSIDANRGDPQNGWDTDQFPNSVEDLVLPLYEILRHGGIAPGGFNFDAKLRRQSTDRDRPVPRAYRRARHARPGAARRRGPGRATASSRERKADRYAGWDGVLGTAILDGGETPRVARGAGRGRRDRRRAARPGSQELLENIVNQSIWTADTSKVDVRPSADGVAFVLGIDVVDDRDQGRPRRRGGRRRRHRLDRVRLRHPRSPLERAGPGAVVGRRGGRDPRRSSPTPGVAGDDVAAVGLTGQMHGAGAARRCRRRCCARRSCGTTSGPPPSATRSARRSGRNGSIAITGNDALTGFTAPKLVWVRDHEPEVWARVAHVLLPKDYVRLRLTGEHALDKADGAGTLLFDLAARDWSPRCSTRSGSTGAWLPPTFEGPEVTGRGHARRRPRRPGCVPAPRSWRAAATRRRTRSGSGPSAAGVVALSLGTSGVVFATTERAAARPGAARSTRSATPCRIAGT